MPSDKKYSIWPAVFVLTVAFGVPTVLGTMEIRIARNAHAETAAIQQLQAIAKAETDYRAANQHFSTKLDELKGLPEPEKFYTFTYQPLSPESYTATAAPNQPGKHGRRYFFVDQTGTMRFDLTQPATATSAVLPPPSSKPGE